MKARYEEFKNLQSTTHNIPVIGSFLGGSGSYASIVKGMPSNPNDVLLKKLDTILDKVE